MLNSKTNAYETQRGYDGSIASTDRTAALFASKKYRAYKEFTTTTTIKLVATKNFFLTSQRIWTGAGKARVVISTGGTESGTFVALPTVFNLRSVPGNVVTPASTLTTGGSVTLGVEREVMRSDSSSAGGGSGNFDMIDSTRYLVAGTYYITITVTGTTDGMFTLEWEEE